MDPSLSGLDDVLLGSLLAALGVLSLAVSAFSRRGVDPTLASFGAFTLLWGVRQFFRSDLIPQLGITPLQASWVVGTLTYLINVASWAFIYQILGKGWRSWIVWWMRLLSAFAVVGILSDLFQGTPGTLSGTPNNILVLAGILFAGASLPFHPDRHSHEMRILMLGLGVLVVFVVNENLVALGWLPWTWSEESIGLLAFVGCLGYVAARRFFLNQTQLVALESELDAARQIQTSILPKRAPEIAGLSIAVRFRPCSAVAGDLYDFLTLESGKLGILVADVSGHGVPAALIASMVKVAATSRIDCADRPVQLLAEVNRTLCGTVERRFVTAAFACLDVESRRLLAANAGHPHPLLRRGADGAVIEIGGRGTVLGRFASASFEEEEIELSPGDRLLFYTDGLVEAANALGEQFGAERLEGCLAESGAMGSEELADALLDRLSAWTTQGEELALDDDLTLVVIDVADPLAPGSRRHRRSAS